MHCRPRSPARPPALVQWALTPRQHLPHLRTQPAIQPASAGRLEQGLEAGGACFSGLIRVAHGGGRLVVVVDTRVPKLRGRGVWGWRWEGAQLVRALPAVRAGRASERTQARCRHPASQPPTPRPPTTPHTSPMLGSRRALRGSVTNTWLMGVKPKGSTRKSLVADCGGLGRGWRARRGTSARPPRPLSSHDTCARHPPPPRLITGRGRVAGCPAERPRPGGGGPRGRRVGRGGRVVRAGGAAPCGCGPPALLGGRPPSGAALPGACAVPAPFDCTCIHAPLPRQPPCVEVPAGRARWPEARVAPWPPTPPARPARTGPRPCSP